MATAGDLINKAMRRAGVLGSGQTLQAQDTTDALADLNQMLAQWAQRRWVVFHLIDTGVVCTGNRSYTIGAGQQFNVARPSRIEAAYIRQLVPASPTPVDFPLYIIESYEEYSRLAMKGLKASPSDSIFYDSGYPTGLLYPWPVPSNQFELHVLTKAPLQQFATVADDIVLPPEYADAIDWNLRARFRSAYRLPMDPYVLGQAKATLSTIKRANFQPDRLRMPYAVRARGSYNILSDQGR